MFENPIYLSIYVYTCIHNHTWLVVWNIFLFSPIIGMMIQSDQYFSGGLKPPTSTVCWTCLLWLKWSDHMTRRDFVALRSSHWMRIHGPRDTVPGIRSRNALYEARVTRVTPKKSSCSSYFLRANGFKIGNSMVDTPSNVLVAINNAGYRNTPSFSLVWLLLLDLLGIHHDRTNCANSSSKVRKIYQALQGSGWAKMP